MKNNPLARLLWKTRYRFIRSGERAFLMQQDSRPIRREFYPLTLNVLAGSGNYDHSALYNFVDQIRPRSILIMDNPGLAMDLQYNFPEMRVLYRNWGINGDDNSSRRFDPVARFYKLAGDVPDGRIGLVFDNEPSYDKQTADYHIKGMEVADKEGRWIGALGTGMGGPEPQEWESLMLVSHAMYSGEPNKRQAEMLKARLVETITATTTRLAPFLQAYDASNKKRIERGLMPHVILLHEYFDFHNPYKPGWNPYEGDNWLIGRFLFLLQACQKMGLDKPVIMISEHGSDSLQSEYHGWLAGKGISEELYASYLTDLMRGIYEPFCELGQAIFTWCPDDQWETFNIKNAKRLQQLLIEDARRWREECTKMPQFSFKQVTVKDGGLAFRSAPGLSSPILFRLAANSTFRALVNNAQVEKDNYTWVQMIRETDGAVLWAASQYLQFSDVSGAEDCSSVKKALSEALTTIEEQNTRLSALNSEIEQLNGYRNVFDTLLEFVEAFEAIR
jgi:hypothetical protein